MGPGRVRKSMLMTMFSGNEDRGRELGGQPSFCYSRGNNGKGQGSC